MVNSNVSLNSICLFSKFFSQINPIFKISFCWLKIKERIEYKWSLTGKVLTNILPMYIYTSRICLTLALLAPHILLSFAWPSTRALLETSLIAYFDLPYITSSLKRLPDLLCQLHSNNSFFSTSVAFAHVTLLSHTHHDDRSIAFIRASVCVYVCVSVRTLESKRLKLQSPNLPQGVQNESWL